MNPSSQLLARNKDMTTLTKRLFLVGRVTLRDGISLDPQRDGYKLLDKCYNQ